MRRRDLIIGLVGGTALLPLGISAQQSAPCFGRFLLLNDFVGEQQE